MEEQEAATWSLCEQEEEKEEEEEHTGDQVRPTQASRWSKYLDTPGEEEEEESNEEGLVGRNHLHGNTTRKRRRAEEPQSSQLEERRDGGCTPAQLKRPAVTSSVTSSAGGSGSRWDHFLRADHQGAEPSVSGWSQATGGAATKPRPLLPASSLFESGEEFDVDDFLTF